MGASFKQQFFFFTIFGITLSFLQDLVQKAYKAFFSSKQQTSKQDDRERDVVEVIGLHENLKGVVWSGCFLDSSVNP